MNNELTLFEQLIIWLSRNKRNFTISRGVYTHRAYIQGDFTFLELANTTVAIMGTNFYYQAESLTELIKFVNGIGY